MKREIKSSKKSTDLLNGQIQASFLEKQKVLN